MASIIKCSACGGDKLQVVGNGIYKCMYCGHLEEEKNEPQQKQQEVVILNPANVQPVYFQAAPNNSRPKIHDRNKTTAIILAAFLGGCGAHKFYLGKIWLGIIYLVFVWTFIPSFISFIDLILLACKSQQEFDEEYNYQ